MNNLQVNIVNNILIIRLLYEMFQAFLHHAYHKKNTNDIY
jgi:hypothetical protein